MEEQQAQEEQIEEQPTWDGTPEFGEEEKSEQQTAPEEPQSEPEEEPIEEEVATEEEPPQTNWEKRYKDLEASHSRRGNEVHSLKQERDDLRLQKIEMQQQMAELNRLKSELKQETKQSEPDPFEDERYWSDDEKEILKEYPEIVKVAEKLAKREAVKAERKLETSTPKYDDKIEELENKIKEQNEYIAQQQAYAKLDSLVGPAWRDVDTDPEFHEFVNGSKMRYRTMVSGDLEEKAEVFQSYLETRKVKDSSSPAPHQDDNRRKAVQGIMKGKTPKEKPKGELSIDELWASIPEHNQP